uniref:Reverse transcriptase domain-containing protein n=1 Tax=Lactuca sativa TaxID=4236 RepID=A0A9R1WUX8_LACSA|nr:hypothetical protein LSAT_V11C900461260 [Lactuca sativa]
MFSRFGTVVDVYIAKKLNRLQRNFGFVRFIRVQDCVSFEKRLNEIFIGAQKLEANVARYQRADNLNRVRNYHPTRRQQPDLVPDSAKNTRRQGRSFAEVVKGATSSADIETGESSKAVGGSTQTRKTIKMLSSPESIDAMQNTLVGTVESFQDLMNVKAFQEVEGCPSMNLRYLGGLKMLLEFVNEQEKDEFLNNGKEIWKSWFKEVSNWEAGENFNERIASIIIQGVPQHAWCEEAFSIIARTWGTVVIPEECNTDSPNLAFGRVGILTAHPGIISSSIKITVDGRPYLINIMEDIFESLKLSPVLAANDFYQRMSWWDEASKSENGSLNSETSNRSEASLQSPRASPAKTQQEPDVSPVLYGKAWNQNVNGEVEVSHSMAADEIPRSFKPVEKSNEAGSPLFPGVGQVSSGSGASKTRHKVQAQFPPTSISPQPKTNFPLDLNIAPSLSNPSGNIDLCSERNQSRISPSPDRTPLADRSPGGSQSTQDMLIRSQQPENSENQPVESNATSVEVFKTINVGESVGFQETKSRDIINNLDRQIWGSPNFKCEVIDPDGLSGGIASFWDPSLFQASEAIKGEGFLAIKGVWLGLRKSCCFVNVYAPQEPIRKRSLWNNLVGLVNSDSDACWFIFGDFNVVRLPEERMGSGFCQSSAYYFNDFIHTLGLLEIKMGGRRFTYMNSAGDKHSKLDRFLVSLNSLNSWPNLNVTALPRVHSDHCAILLSASQLDFGPTPFRFYNSWLEDPDFAKILSNGWSVSNCPRRQLYLSPLSLVANKLKNLKEHIKIWRKEVIGRSKKELDELTTQINDIDLLAEKGLINNEMLKARQNAQQKIIEIESERIKDLKQKSRVKWALEGDENTTFFHGLINKHKRSQRINDIKENGFWITDPVDIKERVLKHFADRFAEPIRSRPKFINSNFKKLPPYRAPGPDGFSFAFLKKHWEEIGSDFYLAVKHYEASGLIDEGCNSSFITLIPKIQDPITLNDFRPISLIGCLYKTISKVLAERLKKVIHHVVSKEQTAFIKDRNILDGPLILNEVISWLKKNKKKAFIFKVDFEKAFDCISWDFLDSIMQQMEFGDKWRAWIRGCLTSARISVLINGAATKEFRMEWGVRQGDPLSPFLFILAAEGLHVAPESARENGVYSGVQLPRCGPSISHLQYADDVIFLGSWSLENTKNLIRILRCYELASGLNVNMSKSKIYGLGVQSCELELVVCSFNCSIGSFPITYLGLPVGVSMVRETHWKPLIEKFRAKLSRWKASTLSFGGRLTLCKSVLGSLGSYYFSLYKAPSKVLKSLERTRMNFFWGGSLEASKMAWVAWEKILASKERGGLGIGSLKAQNLALMGKWWWRFRTQQDNIWAMVIQAIHGSEGGVARPKAVRRKSSCWGSIACLPSFLDKDQVPFLSFFQSSLNLDGSFKWLWSLDHSGVYTVSSLRKHIDNRSLPYSNAGWKWNPLVPGKVNILAWRVSHCRLPCMENLNKLAISSSDLCQMCHEATESVDHICVGCPIAKEAWAQVCSWWRLLGNYPNDCRELLNCKESLRGHNRLEMIHEAIMLVFLWVMWRFRNNKAHCSNLNSGSRLALALEVQTFSHLWINARNRKGRKLRWLEWCCDPILECYGRM